MPAAKPSRPRLRPDHPLAQGLSGAWMMGEGSGPTVYDLSGKGYDAALTSASWVGGQSGWCLSFNGSSAYGLVSSAFGLAGYPFSFGGWMKPSSVADGNTALSFNQSGSSFFYYSLETRSSKWSLVSRNNTFLNATGTTAPSTSRWDHVYFVGESATSQKLYVNGALEATQTTSVSWMSPTQFYLGRLRSTDLAGVWPGLLDGVLVHPRALSALEVEALCADSWAMFRPRRSRLKAAGGTVFTQSLSGSQSSSAAIAKAGAKPLAASQAGSAALAKAGAKPLAGSQAGSASLAKASAKPLSASQAASGSVTRACARRSRQRRRHPQSWRRPHRRRWRHHSQPPPRWPRGSARRCPGRSRSRARSPRPSPASWPDRSRRAAPRCGPSRCCPSPAPSAGRAAGASGAAGDRGSAAAATNRPGEGSDIDIFKKDSGEGRAYTFDFTSVLADGETLSSVTSITQKEAASDGTLAATTDLTIGTGSLSSPLVTAIVSGGTAGKLYVLECKAATSGGQSAIVAGGLMVLDSVG